MKFETGVRAESKSSFVAPKITEALESVRAQISEDRHNPIENTCTQFELDQAGRLRLLHAMLSDTETKEFACNNVPQFGLAPNSMHAAAVLFARAGIKYYDHIEGLDVSPEIRNDLSRLIENEYSAVRPDPWLDMSQLSVTPGRECRHESPTGKLWLSLVSTRVREYADAFIARSFSATRLTNTYFFGTVGLEAKKKGIILDAFTQVAEDMGVLLDAKRLLVRQAVGHGVLFSSNTLVCAGLDTIPASSNDSGGQFTFTVGSQKAGFCGYSYDYGFGSFEKSHGRNDHPQYRRITHPIVTLDHKLIETLEQLYQDAPESRRSIRSVVEFVHVCSNFGGHDYLHTIFFPAYNGSQINAIVPGAPLWEGLANANSKALKALARDLPEELASENANAYENFAVFLHERIWDKIADTNPKMIKGIQDRAAHVISEMKELKDQLASLHGEETSEKMIGYFVGVSMSQLYFILGKQAKTDPDNWLGKETTKRLQELAIPVKHFSQLEENTDRILTSRDLIVLGKESGFPHFRDRSDEEIQSLTARVGEWIGRYNTFASDELDKARDGFIEDMKMVSDSVKALLQRTLGTADWM